jgi:hypothetical protein
MGYRSDVSIAIYGPEDEMAPFIAAQRMMGSSPLVTEREHVQCFGFGMQIGSDPEIVRHHIIKTTMEHVKWYESYPDVQAWERLMDEASENPALSVEFIRIGEETDDSEVRYHGDNCQYFLSVYRAINNSTPTEE